MGLHKGCFKHLNNIYFYLLYKFGSNLSFFFYWTFQIIFQLV
jgi:hypothetical protein